MANPARADLHTHTTASDGDFTPSQLVLHAWNSGLHALAITDHDTTNAFDAALECAKGLPRRPLEIIPGTELSAVHDDREFHLLAYFVDVSNDELQSLLGTIRQRRRERFDAYLARFAERGFAVDAARIHHLYKCDVSLGRRHLAKLLVQSGHYATLRDVFLSGILNGDATIPRHHVPLAKAIETVHAAGGVTSLAHPPQDFSRAMAVTFAALGLEALETNHPSVGYEFGEQLKAWCHELDLLTTGGSDCHGSDVNRPVGCRVVTMDALEMLRKQSGSKFDYDGRLIW
jgi:hypothetical protein